MLKICTVYFEGFYTPDYVGKLYRSLKRNSTVPFQFICLSDNKDVEADIVLPYNHYDKIKKHWHKLKYFSPQFAYQQPGDDIIIMDIDQIIVNNIDDLLTWKVTNGEMLTYGQWWNTKLKINGGFYKFKSGTLKYIWDDFVKATKYWQLHYYNKNIVQAKYYGEQNYVNWKIEEYKAKLSLTPQQWLCKYTNNYMENIRLNRMYCEKFDTDYMILDDVNPQIKICHFAGVGKTIHECDAEFIRKYWK